MLTAAPDDGDLMAVIDRVRRSTRNSDVLKICDALVVRLSVPLKKVSRLDKPWVAAGVSRATWYRQRKVKS